MGDASTRATIDGRNRSTIVAGRRALRAGTDTTITVRDREAPNAARVAIPPTGRRNKKTWVSAWSGNFLGQGEVGFARAGEGVRTSKTGDGAPSTVNTAWWMRSPCLVLLVVLVSATTQSGIVLIWTDRDATNRLGRPTIGS